MTPWDPDGPALPLPAGWEPRRWQVEAVDTIEEGLSKWRSILVSAATGTGKGTFIASYVVRRARQGQRVLFLVHRDELIEDVMGRALEIEPNLPAGKVQGKRNEIQAQVVFASVASLRPKRLAQLGRIDLVITDEAHHATARTYQRVYQAVREANPEAQHLGFTATPFRNAGGGETEGLGQAFEALVYEYDLQQAITDGALAPLECRRIELDIRLEDGKPLTDEASLSAVLDTPALNALVARKYTEHLGQAPAIAFCVSVAHAQHLAAAMAEQGIRAAAVWGNMPRRKREATVAAYQAGTLQVLCNKDLLTEGFDAPRTEGVLLVRPTESRGLFAQMVGRATRLAEGKARGLVLDFVANSDTHDLASFADLTRPEERGPTTALQPGVRVRHRSDKALTEGAVVQIEGEEVLSAEVEWGPDDTRWHPVRELVRLVEGPPVDDAVFTITPRVEGVQEYKVLLFGAGKAQAKKAEAVGWYRYGRGQTTVYTAAGAAGALAVRVQLTPGPAGGWEAWLIEQEGREQPTVACLGRELEQDAAAELGALAFRRRRVKPKPLAARWQRDPASSRQREALKRWGLRNVGELSKGEASWLMDTLVTRAQIKAAKKRGASRRGL